jgi:hypothetical protein
METALFQVELRDFMKDTGIDIPLFPKDLGGQSNEGIRIVDHPGDVVGDPSGSVRGMRAALKNDDLQVRSLAAGLRGCAHPRCVAADDHKSLF